MSAVERVVCVPVTADGQVDPHWGRASRLALVRVNPDGELGKIDTVEVGWDRQHEEGGEGLHHARIARFLREHGVHAVVARHMGPPMKAMLERMRIAVCLGAEGEVRQAIRRSCASLL